MNSDSRRERNNLMSTARRAAANHARTEIANGGNGRWAPYFQRARAAGRCALIPYITAGDPTLAASREIALALAEAGADILELGVPFSDPVADGPVIQRASERALRQGVTLTQVLALAAEIRRSSPVGLLLFGYVNPFLQLGWERLAQAAAEAGVQGVLATDLIPEEAAAYRQALAARGLEPVFLAAPTSPDARLAAIAAASRGFVYAVSRTGVTGARAEVPPGARELVARLRRHTALPIALGFGLSSAAQVTEVARFADGAVVGTALVAAVHAAVEREGTDAAAPAAARFLRSLQAVPGPSAE
ncbi:MAG: tryptophan synthase subunit alpha [Terriglobales bacterium]